MRWGESLQYIKMVIQWCLLLIILVHHPALSQRLVVNTTCLELAKSSNQHLRLSCDDEKRYHCLLDQSYTREFEVCINWAWISEGGCAYYNTYGKGNIDEKDCESLENMTCSSNQYRSNDNTKYNACYIKKEKRRKTTSSSYVVSHGTSETRDKMNGTFCLSSTDNVKTTQWEIILSLSIVIVILVIILILCGIHFCKHSKGLHHCKFMVDKENLESDMGETCGSDDAPSSNEYGCRLEHVLLTSTAENDDSVPKRPETQNCEERKQVEVDEVDEFLDNTSGHSELNVNFQTNEKSVEESEEREENKTDLDKNYDSHSEEEEDFEVILTSPLITPLGCTEDPDNDHATDYESTQVFDDTLESLQREVTIGIDEQERIHCHQLYDLLSYEGLELCLEVLRLVFKRTVGKTQKELLADETVKNKLKTRLPDYCHRILSCQAESETSGRVLYSLFQLYSHEKPTSGWENPVKGSDTRIGDDVERLMKMYIICIEISNPVAISVDNYARLLNVMLTALTRLDSDGAFKDKYKVLTDKLKGIANPNWSQLVHKLFVQQMSSWQ